MYMLGGYHQSAAPVRKLIGDIQLLQRFDDGAAIAIRQIAV
jgi:hypothetical protein